MINTLLVAVTVGPRGASSELPSGLAHKTRIACRAQRQPASIVVVARITLEGTLLERSRILRGIHAHIAPLCMRGQTVWARLADTIVSTCIAARTNTFPPPPLLHTTGVAFRANRRRRVRSEFVGTGARRAPGTTDGPCQPKCTKRAGLAGGGPACAIGRGPCRARPARPQPVLIPVQVRATLHALFRVRTIPIPHGTDTNAAQIGHSRRLAHTRSPVQIVRLLQ